MSLKSLKLVNSRIGLEQFANTVCESKCFFLSSKKPVSSCLSSPPERLLALALRPVPVDAGDGEPFPVEELIQRVRALLCLNEDQSSTSLQFYVKIKIFKFELVKR